MELLLVSYAKVKKLDDVGRFRARLHSCTLRVRDEHRPFLKYLEGEMDNDETIDELWEKLCNYWNYLNYTLLENLTRRIGDEALSKSMVRYVDKMRIFQSTTRVVDFLKYCPIVEEKLEGVDLKSTAEKYDLKWETCTLDDFNELRRGLMHQLMLPAIFGLPMWYVGHHYNVLSGLVVVSTYSASSPLLRESEF